MAYLYGCKAKPREIRGNRGEAREAKIGECAQDPVSGNQS